MKTTNAILTCLALLAPVSASYCFEAHVYGPNYTCPNSELMYSYDDDYGCGLVTLSVTHGLIFNQVTQQWVTSWSFNSSQGTFNDFLVKWDNSPLGTVGNIHVKVCDCTFTFICSNGDRNVTFGPSPGTPVISGTPYILNCQSQQQNFSAVNLPEGWELDEWSLSSNLEQVGSGTNPITVKATTTTYQGMETLTGEFVFTTDGNTCGSVKYVNKNIWVGKPSPNVKTVDGFPYSSGYQICPGNHWVGVTWNGQVTSTSWTVTPGISYSTNNNECDFYLPSSGYSSVAISVNGTNACGTSYNASYYLSKKTFGCGSLLIMVYPNPAKDELTVQTSLLNEKENLQYDVPVDEIALFDKSNKKPISLFPIESNIKLDTKNIPNGEYFLHIKFGEDRIMKHIFIDK